MTNPNKLQGASLQAFTEGIGLVLSRWSALRAAVENEWAGRDTNLKAHKLAADVLAWFTQSKETLYIDDLEDLLYKGGLSINLVIEDGSDEEVAEELMIMYGECLEGNFSSVERLREASRNPAAYSGVQKIVNGNEDEDDDSDENNEDDNSANMDVDIPRSESNLNSMNKTVNGSQQDNPGEDNPGEGDDGWSVVSRRKNKGRKN